MVNKEIELYKIWTQYLYFFFLGYIGSFTACFGGPDMNAFDVILITIYGLGTIWIFLHFGFLIAIISFLTFSLIRLLLDIKIEGVPW
jgi:hypothetical protein